MRLIFHVSYPKSVSWVLFVVPGILLHSIGLLVGLRFVVFFHKSVFGYYSQCGIAPRVACIFMFSRKLVFGHYS